ncbi:MAG: hypothetical protein KME23_05220 [Goleter apudmare HA4340-LM2]|jgi:hypothetical protein|nr:hypothetical protein [Goleter apudmare HA4340-LM2]
MNISINKTRKNCRFCSEISQANGEDPIGSAIVVEQYLIIEAAQPWPVNIWIEPEPMPQGVLDALNYVWGSSGTIRQLAIAPDKEYSHPDYTRVLYYCRPAKLFAQIAEREIWMQEGWRWLEYHKTGQILASDEINQEWADVRIDFTTPDGSSSAYQARVEVKGSVITAWNSAEQPSLKEVKQYHVSSLVKLT